jgi:hypothetical protein
MPNNAIRCLSFRLYPKAAKAPKTGNGAGTSAAAAEEEY